MVNTKISSWRWRSSIQSENKNKNKKPRANCGSDHELFIEKFRLKLKKVGKTTRSFKYDINQIPYNHTLEVTNRFKGLDLLHRVPEELCMEVWNIVQEAVIKTIPKGYSFAPFWCLCQKLSLSPLYFNKTLLHKGSERSSLVSGPGLNSSLLEAKNPASHRSATTIHLGGSSGILQDKMGLTIYVSLPLLTPEILSLLVWSSRQCLPVLGSLLYCIPQSV